MTSNNQFTSPFDALLRPHVYGEISVRRFLMGFCESTCRDWEPMSSAIFVQRPWESSSNYERRFDLMVEAEEESQICRGHLVLHETIRGMLRSYSYKPASDDRSRDGSLSLAILPWDDQTERLTCKRTVVTRVFHYEMRADSLYIVNGDGSSALELSLKPWRTRAE